MYKLQSVHPPPTNRLSMEHGDVVITRLEDSVTQPPAMLQIVGSAQTLSMAQQTRGEDWLQTNDPWAGKSKSAQQQSPAFAHDDPMNGLEDKIVTSVLKKMEAGKDMEVDSDPSLQARVSQLEDQIKGLSVQQTVIKEAVEAQGVENAVQIQQLQASFQSQHGQLELALQHSANQFREEMAQQSRRQESQLNTMFGKQLEQFEALMAQHDAKKPRTD